MQYGFLSTLVPESMKDKVRSLSSNNMQDAANALQWHLYNGFCKNLCEKVELINVLPIGSFPQYYKEAFVKESVFSTDYSDDNINVGFCNIKFLRKFIQPSKIYKALLRWYKKSDDEKTLFIYTVSSPFIKAVYKLKRRFPNVKVCAIIADLPDMSNLSSKKSMAQKLFEKFLARDAYSRLDCIDYFVLLTKYMADYMGIKKPFCIVEGISSEMESLTQKSDNNAKNILYTGTLHKRFGVMNLVSAFEMIDNDNYRLIICGIGDSKDEIIEEAKKDSRIIYKGQLPREEILKLQQSATCLVNPRQANEEFTKYSFPSKNLEYLSTGIPVVAYKLQGIPDEYDDYIFYVKDNSLEALRDKLLEVCEDETSAKDKAEKAKEFVLNNKNEVAQTKIILDMLR